MDTYDLIQTLDNNEMHAKPDLRAVKSKEINFSGSVISAVISQSGGNSIAMMTKLYKRDATGKLLYHEAWTDDGECNVTVHTGTVGRDGKNYTVPWDPEGETEDAVLERILSDARKKGFEEVPLEQQMWAVIQFKLKSFSGSKRDYKKWERIRQNLDQVLGWKGVGHVDGGDIGTFTMNIVAIIVDEAKGVPAIKGYLRTYHEDLHKATIGVRPFAGGKWRVVHPADYDGELLA